MHQQEKMGLMVVLFFQSVPAFSWGPIATNGSWQLECQRYLRTSMLYQSTIHVNYKKYIYIYVYNP